MNDKKYQKRIEFQTNVISRQSERIKSLESEIEDLKFKLKEKDEQFLSVESLKRELTESVQEHKKFKNEYQALVEELKKMKKIFNEEVLKNRWWLIKFLIK